MKSSISTTLFQISFALFSGGCWIAHAATNPPLDFKEVYQLVQSNLTSVTEAQLDDAAARGLIEQLGPRVHLARPEPSGTNVAPAALSAKVYDRSYGYLRISTVSTNLSKQLADAYKGLSTTNRLKGIVVDLRYAAGDDYAAAAAAADQFFATEQPMIDYGEGVLKSTAKTNSVVLPVAILVNNETARAAEALAAILRQAEVGLLLGSTTAGQASIFKDFVLKGEQRLRIAVAPVKVGSGEALPLTGLVPDIQVSVSADDGLAYYKDPYTVVAKAAFPNIDFEGGSVLTNRVPRRRLNEAELLRMMREGISPESEAPAAPPQEVVPARPILRDPVLARAIDLLKGLAVVQQFRAI